MQLPADRLEFHRVVRGERGLPLILELTHRRYDGRLVDPRDVVMLVDAERLREGREQMFLVHLRVALDRLVVLHILRNFAKFLNRLLFQLVKCVCHATFLTSSLPRNYCGLVATYLIVPSISP